MLRILGGEFRRRQLMPPPDHERSRPMPARVKESLCNLLRGWFEDANVLDLFSGVGTMGLEAVSRGAADVVMVEQDRDVHAILDWNIRELGCRDRCRAIRVDALGPTALAQAPDPVDLAFIDPPYLMMEDPRTRAAVLQQVAALEPVLADKAWVVLRSPLALDEAESGMAPLQGPELHEYAEDMLVYLYYNDRLGRTGESES